MIVQLLMIHCKYDVVSVDVVNDDNYKNGKYLKQQKISKEYKMLEIN